MIFLHTNMKIFDDDYQFRIKNIDKLIWIFVIVFLSDMKQQQESIDFFESRATKFCRFCNFDANNRKDLFRDTIANEKYHFEMKKLRRDILRLFEITKIKTSFVKNDLIAKSSIFEKIISTLNIIMSFFLDFVHSEYYELIKQLYSMLEKNILISTKFEQFNDVFQSFSFSSE
jgi:DNA-binding ferritin-like protein (Dps family)